MEEGIDIGKSNMLIALFMGYEKSSLEEQIKWLGCRTEERMRRLDPSTIPVLKEKKEMIYLDHLDYNSSWSFLMPAYVKCMVIMKEVWKEKKENHTIFMEAVTNLNQCTLLLGERNGVHDEETMKLAVYKSVIGFAEWLEKNKNNERD